MKKKKLNFKRMIPAITFVMLSLGACTSEDDATDTDDLSDDPTEEGETSITELSAAFGAFSDAVTVTLSEDGTEIEIETTGYPNHETLYWEPSEDLYIDEPLVTMTTADSYIGSGTGEAASFVVDATPDLTGDSVETALVTVGIAVSGGNIFNDQEGPLPLGDEAYTLDYNGAHKGPSVYHYHLEPKSFSNDDDALVGILVDGVFIYGRKCSSTATYPTDLDASGGHTSTTQYEDDAIYHYHIINEQYDAPLYAYDEAIVLFAGPLQGY